LVDLIKVKKVEVNQDITIINGLKSYSDIFDKEYKLAKTSKMIIITNTPKKSKETKKTLNYLKTIKAKHE